MKMGMTEFIKAIIDIWLLAQLVIVPLIIINDEDVKAELAVDFGALVMLIIMFFGLKLIVV